VMNWTAGIFVCLLKAQGLLVSRDFWGLGPGEGDEKMDAGVPGCEVSLFRFFFFFFTEREW